jgi:tetratricopeptide (TPR) repeat protein
LEKDGSKGKKASGVLGRLFAHVPAALVAILLIPTLWYLFKEGRRYSVVVDSISVPKRFEEVGLTGDVIAGRVAAAMQQIEQRSHTRLATDLLAPSGVAAPAQNAAITSIEMPGTHLSLKVLEETAQTVFGHPPNRVSGDIVISAMPDPGSPAADFEATITIRVQRPGRPFDSRTAVVKTSNADVLAYRAAALALQTLNPYVLAVDDEQRGDIRGALTLVRQLTEDPDLDRKHKFATYVLWAKALADEREFSAAIEKYQSAEKWGANDSSLYLSWGATLFEQKDYAGALGRFNRALQLSPTS